MTLGVELKVWRRGEEAHTERHISIETGGEPTRKIERRLQSILCYERDVVSVEAKWFATYANVMRLTEITRLTDEEYEAECAAARERKTYPLAEDHA